ncbi:2-methylaconitate cis-trans isomerase PrpF family protein [Roseitranquillus sediminis]|uniref:2-methylaconitate cis-trans isomerase PrpF family protein n=1 Tax=Roseitranquillus sediminis TaxID=2809051 RepID=UPI001D0C545C|nr:PrpF domain-containing protein [Roseitranquillus sediminis]MBM9593858.1 4-oxalomesaconate tautomerase [Roseitranquillus sediminis]
MRQTEIPYVMMRGGTSRGPFMRRSDVPEDLDELARVLIAIIGAGHPQNIDGLGGGTPVATKTAMLSVSQEEGIDVDYFFAQVAVDKEVVDFAPTCGNMLSAVGPAAVELGLISPPDGETTTRIRCVNTGAYAEATHRIEDGLPVYDGNEAIDGVNGTAATVVLRFEGTVGSRTGALLPTGNVIDRIGGIDVTCIDVAMPMVMARATDLGVTGHEPSAELDADADLFARFEPIRREAGRMMGFGDVSDKVVPKFGIVAEPQRGGAVAARYFMPWKTHPTMAVTGSQCFAALSVLPGSVADGIARTPPGLGDGPVRMTIEHPIGGIHVELDASITNSGLDLRSAGLIRTARMLAKGVATIPAAIWRN